MPVGAAKLRRSAASERQQHQDERVLEHTMVAGTPQVRGARIMSFIHALGEALRCDLDQSLSGPLQFSRKP